jgi:ABC-type branched-subunit amino acid transport system substrate-binding protein
MGTSRTGRPIAAALLLLALTDCDKEGGSSQADVIRIGTFIQEDINGADEVLAAREINAAGGITIDGKSFRLEVIRVLQGETPASAVKAVKSLAEQHAVAALGPRWSSVTLGQKPDHSDGAAQAAIDHGMLMMSGFATSAAISALSDDDLIWRTIPSDDFQGIAGAKFAYEGKHARKVAVLYRDDAWGRGLSATFVSAFEALGGAVLTQVAFDPSQDLDRYAFPELAQVFAEPPDLVYIAAFGEFSQISNRIVQGGYLKGTSADQLPFLATDGSNSNEILTNAAPEVLDRLYGTVPGSPPDDANFEHFAAAYVREGLGPRDDAWPFPYDAMYLVALAMQAANSLDPNEFKQHMRAVSRADAGDLTVQPGDWAKAKQALLAGRGVDYQGASGPIDFTAQGDPGEGYYSLWQIQRGPDNVFHFDYFDSVAYAAQ